MDKNGSFKLAGDGELSIHIEVQRDSPFRGCNHWRLVIDEKSNTVVCKECGNTLDPIRTLLKYSEWMRSQQNMFDRISAYQESNYLKRTLEPPITGGRRTTAYKPRWEAAIDDLGAARVMIAELIKHVESTSPDRAQVFRQRLEALNGSPNTQSHT